MPYRDMVTANIIGLKVCTVVALGSFINQLI